MLLWAQRLEEGSEGRENELFSPHSRAMADKPGVELAPRDAYSSVAVPIVVIVLFLFVVIPNLRDVDSLGRRVLTRVRPLFTCSWRLLLSCCCPCYVFAENVEKCALRRGALASRGRKAIGPACNRSAARACHSG